MSISASEISDLIKKRIKDLNLDTEARTEGTVVSLADGVARIHGVSDVMSGEMVEFPGNTYGLALNLAKDASGRSHTVETTDVTPTKGAVAGGWFGLLASLLVTGPVGLGVILGGVAAGALYGKVVDRGLDDEWVKGMADWIDPGTSALLLLVDDGFDAEVIEEIGRFEGTGEVVYSTLPSAVREDIEEALSGGGSPA